MPEFVLSTGDEDSAARYAKLDDFTRGYIQAMFFTDTGDGDDAEKGLEEANVGELAPKAWAAIILDCASFQARNCELLEQATNRDGYDWEAAGRDFWFTRNGHGVGFWDRGALDADGLGDRLSKACGWRTDFAELHVYRGDDGLIYVD